MQVIDRPQPRDAEVVSTAGRFVVSLRVALGAVARFLRIGRKVNYKLAADQPAAIGAAGTLAQVIADLDLLNHNTEQDFLRIGGKLSDFIESVNLISTELTTLANSNTEGHGQLATAALSHALDRSIEMKARYADHGDDLGGMREEAGRLKQTLSGFAGTVSTIRTLGVLTRIETARLGSAGAEFGSLADDVKLLAGSVQNKVENAVDATALLFAPIESAMRDISALEAGQAEDLPAAIAGVLASLASFRTFCEAQALAHDSSVLLGAQSEAILGAFKQLIVSIQFHDLTRQQVEHVIDVLRRLCAESLEDRNGISRDLSNVASVLAVQSAQLADAGLRFAASVASVTRNLDRIAAHVLELAAQSRTLSGLSEQEKDAFFLQMERGCNAGMASLSQCASVESATRLVSGNLEETIGRMQTSIEEIATIEIQMHRMALNASISAAHIGSQGDALGVLAGSMQQQAFEARQRSESLEAALGYMSRAATRLSGPRAGEGAIEESLLDGVRTAVEDLHSSSERSFAQIAQIVALGASLHMDLIATRASFSVGALFAASIGRARGMLEAVREQSQPSMLRPGTRMAESDLTGFTEHYTMQAELDVHESLASVGTIAAPAAAPAPQAGCLPEIATELGENVEFF